MRIELTEYNTTPDSTIRIYRSYSPFSSTELPPVLTTLSPGTLEWHDTSVGLNEVVYYRVSVVHNDVEIVGPMYTTIKRFYTGPQKDASIPDRILRGDSIVGRYDSFPAESTLPIRSILDLLQPFGIELLPGTNVSEIEYEKCIHNGQIVFMPTKPFLLGTLEQMYKAGALFTYGTGYDQMAYSLYTSIPFNERVDQGRNVVGRGSTFRLRVITQKQYDELHVKLYPNTAMGSICDRLIGNCNAYPQRIPVIQPNLDGTAVTCGLDGSKGSMTWTGAGPIYIVAELLNRSDLVYPEPDEETHSVGDQPAIYDCGRVVHKNRVHWFGGRSLNTAGAPAITNHFSTDLDGQDYKEHAPMPVGTAYSVSWSDGVKLYTFGGMTKQGSSNLYWAEKTSLVQVWDDAGTNQGIWTSITPNVEFNMCSAGLVRVNPSTGKNQIWVIGGDKEMEPELSRFSYVADIEGFDGTFTKVPAGWALNRTPGGQCMFEYHGKTYGYGGGGYLGVISAIMTEITFPASPGGAIYSSSFSTTGSESPATKTGRTGYWHDTIFLSVDSLSGKPTGNYFDVWQWVAPERRFRTIRRYSSEISPDSLRNCIWHENKCYVLHMPFGTNGSGGPAKVSVLTYHDPLEQPLKPLEAFAQKVNRYYPKQLQMG